MLSKIVKTTALIALTTSALNAAEFNAQAEKDKAEIVKYFEAKFADPEKNRNTFFPYSTDEELKNNFNKGLKHDDFGIGSYAYSKDAKVTYDALKEFPPYEPMIDEGEELFNKPFANGKSLASCFPDPAVTNIYPYFDEKRNELISLTQAINECVTSNGEKAWNTQKGDMAKVQAYMAYQTTEAGKKIDIKIQSKAAQEAYEKGKEYYYTQRGYLKMSCATCHVQGSGQRVRNENLSPMLGAVTHWPVYRLKWQDLGTIERRLSGCVVDQGQVPPKDTSAEMKELIYYMSYISNGMAVDGPDVRK